jgi:serine/threonine-protein kinase
MTTVADPLVGLVLAGRYRIVSHIARGGMATVYRAHDLNLGREIAVKVMHPNIAQDEEFVARFIGEAKSAAGLSHPNVVMVYDQGFSDRHVFLVMEYVPGRTLRDLLKERGRLGPRQALSLLQPILAALGAAHRAGLVHRDVKPENVLLTDDGQVKVADFGLARAVSASNQTKTGLIMGTVAYMAPEQVVSSSSDARSDVYAAGILLFELLTGMQPHRAESPLAVAYKHVNEVVPLPSSVLRGMPPQLDTLVAAATARDPARRPPDADRFLAVVAGVDAALPPDIDQALADAIPAAPHNSTDVLQLPPALTAQQAPTPGPHAEPHQHTAMLPAGMFSSGLLNRDTPQREEPTVIDRVLSAFTGRLALIGVGLIAMLVLGCAVWYQTAGQYRGVPSVVGLTMTDARAQLEAKGYKVIQGRGKSSYQVEKGKVGATDPSAGSRISQGAVITLFPSLGRDAVPVPDLKGKSPAEAQQQLSRLGFNTTTANEPSGDIAQGMVTRTQPTAGERAQPGPGSDPVTIYVSTGTLVPGVVGKSPGEATQILQDAGFRVNITQLDASGGQPSNTVLSQSPPAGTNVGKGSLITLVATKKDSSAGNGSGNGKGTGKGSGKGKGKGK